MITKESLNQRPLSYSSLKEFAKSPAHYIEYLRKEREPSKEMLFGSMIHCLLLTPQLFEDQFAVMANVDKRTKEGKLAYEKFVADAIGKDVVAEQDYDDANNLVNKVITQSHITDLIKNCNVFEEEWKADIDGLPFRGFYDGVADDYILEIKTTSDGNPRTIINDFYNRQYHIQAGLYHKASGSKPIKYVIIETKAPYNIYVADSEQAYLDYGINQFSSLIDKFKECLHNNLWDMGYDFHTGGNITIGLPSWVK